MTAVRFPEMRREILSALDALADPAYQQRVWIEKRMPTPQYHDDLDLNVHILYDDTSVLPDPGTGLGAFLADAAEVEALREVGAALDPLISGLGDASDATYLADGRWPSVVAAAKVAAGVLRAHGGE